MDAACPPALRSQLLAVTVRVLELGAAVAAGEDVAAEVGEWYALVDNPLRRGK